MNAEHQKYLDNIIKGDRSIYSAVVVGEPDLWIPSDYLETILNERLTGLSVAGLALRTRSKVVKTMVCEALGYEVPKSFKKTNPRFPCQNFDIYIQKSNNLQIWNEEIEPTRRYIIIQVTEHDLIGKIRVVTGSTLDELDTTGTLTQKYQARLIVGEQEIEIIASEDTDNLKPLVTSNSLDLNTASAIGFPEQQSLMSINTIANKLSGIVGKSFEDAGIDQERNRGDALHKLISEQLGYGNHADNGQFPDVRHQLLEIKLQTSPTIDLGLVTPDSLASLDIPILDGIQVRHCDVRYALFYGSIENGMVIISNFYLTTGQSFFNRFPQFGGKTLNKKIQIPLPNSFFN